MDHIHANTDPVKLSPEGYECKKANQERLLLEIDIDEKEPQVVREVLLHALNVLGKAMSLLSSGETTDFMQPLMLVQLFMYQHTRR